MCVCLCVCGVVANVQHCDTIISDLEPHAFIFNFGLIILGTLYTPLSLHASLSFIKYFYKYGIWMKYPQMVATPLNKEIKPNDNQNNQTTHTHTHTHAHTHIYVYIYI